MIFLIGEQYLEVLLRRADAEVDLARQTFVLPDRLEAQDNDSIHEITLTITKPEPFVTL